jgi:hypothetical protein
MTKKAKIKHATRVQTWNQYIGTNIGRTLCLMCQRNYITPFEFVCCHVLAESQGGSVSVENLRPLCTWCNLSMGTQHMKEFARINYPQSPLLLTLPDPPTVAIPSPTPNTTFIINVVLPNGSVSNYTPQNVNFPNHNISSDNVQSVSVPKITNPVNINYQSSVEKLRCEPCGKTFARKDAVVRHIQNKHCKEGGQTLIEAPAFVPISDFTEAMAKVKSEMITAIKAEFSATRRLTNGSIDNQNKLNVIPLTNQDDLIYMLMKQESYEIAINFINKCVSGKLKGDRQLIEKIYFPNDKKPAFMYTNQSRKELVYYNKDHQRVIETNLQAMAKLIAQNIKSSYIIIRHALIKYKGSNPYKLDLVAVNQRILELGDINCQMELFKTLNIPIENDIN